MLALCLMLLATYYAQNYAGIIGWSLLTIKDNGNDPPARTSNLEFCDENH